MAYIDPGNGAYMVQVLFTLAGAAIFYLRHPIQALKSVWRWVVQRHTGALAEGLDRTVVQTTDNDLEIAGQTSKIARDPI